MRRPVHEVDELVDVAHVSLSPPKSDPDSQLFSVRMILGSGKFTFILLYSNIYAGNQRWSWGGTGPEVIASRKWHRHRHTAWTGAQNAIEYSRCAVRTAVRWHAVGEGPTCCCGGATGLCRLTLSRIAVRIERTGDSVRSEP